MILTLMLQIDREAPKMHPMPFAANRFMTQLQPVLGSSLKYFFYLRLLN
jgi:hypothetical protein